MQPGELSTKKKFKKNCVIDLSFNCQIFVKNDENLRKMN